MSLLTKKVVSWYRANIHLFCEFIFDVKVESFFPKDNYTSVAFCNKYMVNLFEWNPGKEQNLNIETIRQKKITTLKVSNVIVCKKLQINMWFQ